jgi:hypothetical protein
MAEEKATAKKRRPRRPDVAMSVQLWMVDGGPLPEEAKRAVEDAVERAVLGLFNDGHRILTSTSYGR